VRRGGALLVAAGAALWGTDALFRRGLANELAAVEAFVLLVALGHGVQAGAGDVPALAGLALVPGLAALLLYYRGLRSTPAATATLAELAFPATALVVNAIAFGTVPTGSQLLGAGLLAATVAALGLADRRSQTGVWIKISAPRMSRA
jgi:drug/metabolite transporter (DMT)-like permease